MIDWEVQGHRGARAVSPENTWPSFETALDAGADSIETDVLPTADGVAVLCHDERLNPTIVRRITDMVPSPEQRPAVRALTLAEWHGYVADGNPDVVRFPQQRPVPTPRAEKFAAQQGRAVFALPTLTEACAFVREHPRGSAIVLDVELKQTPAMPVWTSELLESAVLTVLRSAGLRVRIRSFDHRLLRWVRQAAPSIPTAILLDGNALVDPVSAARAAGATMLCPRADFVDADMVRLCRAAGVAVLPWTVNDESAWTLLRDWGVAGVTTDDPGRLVRWSRVWGEPTA